MTEDGRGRLGLADHDNPPPAAVARAYEKGSERYKHVGDKDVPEIVHVPGAPKHALGKCPKAVPDDVRTTLLNEAIPLPVGDEEVPLKQRLHVVHEGAIYRAETTSAGVSFHAYPYAGKLGKGLIAELRGMADRKNCVKEFDKWVARHITPHGK